MLNRPGPFENRCASGRGGDSILRGRVVCGIFSKKKDHGICGLYHQTTTPGGICHGQEELYRIGI
ncbi:MAG: hypothetical protein EOM08_16175 [Clostridia bacterium]|nr:hypothetical protein [Clostridia bacterium]